MNFCIKLNLLEQYCFFPKLDCILRMNLYALRSSMNTSGSRCDNLMEKLDLQVCVTTTPYLVVSWLVGKVSFSSLGVVFGRNKIKSK